ncbi:hypothetical protein QTP88_020760 [Uroleucon formosanum]
MIPITHHNDVEHSSTTCSEFCNATNMYLNRLDKNFPLKDIDSLKEIEENIKSEDYKTKMKNLISSIGGATYGQFKMDEAVFENVFKKAKPLHLMSRRHFNHYTTNINEEKVSVNQSTIFASECLVPTKEYVDSEDIPPSDEHVNSIEDLGLQSTEINFDNNNNNVNKLIVAFKHTSTVSTYLFKLVRPGGMGDRKPSQLLRDMRSVMPDGFGEDALKEFWLQKLPANVVVIVSGFEGSLDSIAARADRVMEAANSHNVDAVAKDPIAELTSVVSSLAQQVQSMAKVVFAPRQSDRPSTLWTAQQATDLCYFHERFGNNARKCRPPCNFKAKSKEHTTPTPAEN